MVKFIWLLLFLVGCTISKKEIETANEICEDNGGFLYIHLDLFDKVVRCKNAHSMSISKYEEEKEIEKKQDESFD